MSYKVIVAGGGLIGVSTAYYLAKSGVDVTLVDSKDIAAGTSGACDRAIMLQSKKPGPTLNLSIKSANLYKDLEAELEADLEYRKCGGMIIIETMQEMKAMEDMVERQRKAGIDVRLISGDEARQRQPGLSKNILGSTFWEHDAEVNPLYVCFAMARAAQRLGAEIRLQSPVTGLITENDRVIGVDVSGERLYADAVVVALGVWTPLLLKEIGIDVPIIPRRGQILVSERIDAFVNYGFLSASYIANKLKGNQKDDPFGIGLALGQTRSGTLLIGGSRQFAGYNTETNPEITRKIGEAAVRAFPQLANVRIIRTFAGLRPFTPDNMPILGPVDGIDGLYIAAGHEGDGIALAPISGKIMAQVVCGEESNVDISPFLLSRFNKNNSGAKGVDEKCMVPSD
ncbi:FAD-binding oxidoreductase [Siminovitchia acidinfaciens]|uniref:FAD-binding oxidoreductase n=1 Tax=Siminovitchia acidinfaciens TaxID=2321395 RepID=A0A429XV34_9BACI|nr:FAD-binding oxidoreductase [Siminovitchia acidinfaciens]RST72047.1 FAD-binding oxidoreductase [Siminovitchia acidinfaciens]